MTEAKAETRAVPPATQAPIYVNVPSPDATKRKQLAAIAPEVSITLDALKQGDPIPSIVQEAMGLIRSPASNSLQLAEFSNARYRLGVSAEVDLRLLHRHVKFWSSLAGRGLQRFDDIRAVSEDQCAMADFIVVDADERFVDCALIDFHKIMRRVCPQGETTWLHDGDTLSMRPPKGTQHGGIVIVRADGVELTESGLPFKDVEAARRHYLDHATNRDSKTTQYFPR